MLDPITDRCFSRAGSGIWPSQETGECRTDWRMEFISSSVSLLPATPSNWAPWGKKSQRQWPKGISDVLRHLIKKKLKSGNVFTPLTWGALSHMGNSLGKFHVLTFKSCDSKYRMQTCHWSEPCARSIQPPLLLATYFPLGTSAGGCHLSPEGENDGL